MTPATINLATLLARRLEAEEETNAARRAAIRARIAALREERAADPAEVERIRKAAQILRAHRRAEAEAAEEIAAFNAPSECVALVSRSLDRRTQRELNSLGFADEGAAYRAILGITTVKWAYENV